MTFLRIGKNFCRYDRIYRGVFYIVKFLLEWVYLEGEFLRMEVEKFKVRGEGVDFV